MPQIRKKHRKVKRATDIRKRSQYMRNYLKYKSYIPLCEKLKTNNNSLAKALSAEKQACQLLFSENVALSGKVQDLSTACNKREAVITNALMNAKEMLKMLVTMTSYVTNTISTCQEFTASMNTNLRMSYNSTGRRDSYRRMSTKSPTKGVVKPMVSGHTITKPTINLSRVNMQHINNNASNLSIIPEVVTPPRNQETNSPRSPVPVSVRQRRYGTARTCRMPERLTVSSPRSSEENERRLSKRSSRHSGRISGKRSRPKSGRLSGNNSTRCSIGNFEHIGSPTVKLNDVSKFLQNSQSINIRLLTENGNDDEIVNEENSDDANQNDSETAVTVPETPPSDSPRDDNDMIVENNDGEIDSKLDDKVEQRTENPKTVPNPASNWEDPLEGPSWLFNNFQTVPCYTNNEKKTDNVNVSINNSMCRTLKLAADTSDESDDEKYMEESQFILNEQESQINNCKSVAQGNSENESINSPKNINDDRICATLIRTTPKDTNQDECKTKNEPSGILENFITHRRGYVEEEEDDDEFTLMYVRHPRDLNFDINDLKLPVLEESALKPAAPVEPEPEITATLRKISQICPIPSVSNNSLNETVFNHSTVKLPLLMNNDYDNDNLTPFKEKSVSMQRRKRVKHVTLRDSADFIDGTPRLKTLSKEKNKKNQSTNKDPSAAKVVLQKLDESDVKSRTPSPEEIQDFNQTMNTIPKRSGNSSDSESSNSSVSSNNTVGRPLRRRAPTNFQEPSLRRKLRRNN
ncbi:uncharacterized protein LOC116429396 isoform X2 [Nomia melanderi]